MVSICAGLTSLSSFGRQRLLSHRLRLLYQVPGFVVDEFNPAQ